jgi:protein-S-isoprenylcysteine O-methyltransferase Ste14
MPNEENKFKNNIWMKQIVFLGLAVLWILLVLFKNSLGAFKWPAFAVLVILTIIGLYQMNKAFFGINKLK